MISRRSRKALLICAAICIVFIPLVSARASKTTFYPEECIGDWKELQNAEGKTDAHDVAEIDSSNAAESNRVGSRVVCSKFSDASLSNLRPTFAELSLFVRPIGSHSTSTIVSQILKKYSTNVFAEEENVVSTTTIEVTTPSTSTEVSMPVIVEEQSTSTVVEISTSTPVLDEATSSLESIPAVVDATSTVPQPEEIIATTTTEIASTTVPELPVQSLESSGISTEEILIDTASSTEVVEVLSSDPEIEAQISFDEGVTWTLVGNGVVSGTNPISFVVPLTSLKTGDDVSKLSVRIIKTGGSSEVLLDSMSLSVSFAPLTDNDRKVVLGDVLEKNPDFSGEVITQMVNVPHAQIISTTDAHGVASLWIYTDTPSGTTTPFLVATGERFVAGAPIAVKDGIVFWLNGVDDLYGFNVADHRILVPLSKRERDSGEREFIFSETPWKVVSRGGSIQFFSGETGEIGGDDDGSLRQVFYSNRLESHFSEEGKELLGEFGIDTGVMVAE